MSATGEFYAAHLTRFTCEWCKRKAAFVVVMWSKELNTIVSACPECAAYLKKEGWKKV